MEITEVRIKLMDDPSERLKAFCSITVDDCFVIRDLKIIEGSSGPFVAMPSRKLTAHCPNCGSKNHLRANYCNQCGRRLGEDRRQQREEEGRTKLYADIAHPINSSCRESVQASVIEAFPQELKRAQEPGYRSRYDDLDDLNDIDLEDDIPSAGGSRGTTATASESCLSPAEASAASGANRRIDRGGSAGTPTAANSEPPAKNEDRAKSEDRAKNESPAAIPMQGPSALPAKSPAAEQSPPTRPSFGPATTIAGGPAAAGSASSPAAAAASSPAPSGSAKEGTRPASSGSPARGPHTPPSEGTRRAPAPAGDRRPGRSRGGGFGAGIFED